MKIAVLGTGMVGKSIGNKLVALGHDVRMGSRTADNAAAAEWAAASGGSHSTFADAAAFGEAVFNCTQGEHTVAALTAAGAANLEGKIVIDLANPLDFSRGFPPRLSVCNDESLGEQVQRAFPGARVVKTLNTMNCMLMVDPSGLPGEHAVLVSGDDAAAKEEVSGWLRDWFGWRQIVDLGDITTARGTEAWLLLWTRLYGALGTPHFNMAIVR
jgi:predicted dinucleotide-binding enzyme